MLRRLWPWRASRDHTSGTSVFQAGAIRRSPTDRRLLMQWQTPTAIDWRFGFEITLYAAAR